MEPAWIDHVLVLMVIGCRFHINAFYGFGCSLGTL